MTLIQEYQRYKKDKRNLAAWFYIVLNILYIASIPLAIQGVKEEVEWKKNRANNIKELCEFTKHVQTLQNGTPLPKENTEKLKLMETYCHDKMVSKNSELESSELFSYIPLYIEMKRYPIFIFIFSLLILLIWFVDSLNPRTFIRNQSDDLFWYYNWIWELKMKNKLRNLEDFKAWMTMPERYTPQQLEVMEFVFLSEKAESHD